MQQYSAFVDAHEEWQHRLRLANERVEKAKHEERYWFGGVEAIDVIN